MFRWILRIDEAALASLPELKLFSNEQRRKALKDMEQLSARSFIQISAYALLIVTLFPFLSSRFPQSAIGFAGLLACVMTGAVLIRCGAVYITRRNAARFFRERLLQYRVPVCMECGYFLRGVMSDRCSECGAELSAFVRTLIREEGPSHGVTAPDGSLPPHG